MNAGEQRNFSFLAVAGAYERYDPAYKYENSPETSDYRNA
jgi:hypothetical protein